MVCRYSGGMNDSVGRLLQDLWVFVFGSGVQDVPPKIWGLESRALQPGTQIPLQGQ